LIVLNSAWIARALKETALLRAIPSSEMTDALIRAVTYWDTLWFDHWFTCFLLAACCPFLAWAALDTLRLCGPQAPDRATSFDAVAASPATARRSLALWAALVTLCLCAMPALFAAALFVYQSRLMRLE